MLLLLLGLLGLWVGKWIMVLLVVDEVFVPSVVGVRILLRHLMTGHHLHPFRSIESTGF